MAVSLYFIILFAAVTICNGVSILEQLAHIARRRHENLYGTQFEDTRRNMMAPNPSVILGAPSYPSHLPAAEPILPGHTLLRPAMNMLKSSMKFPHRELENGAGVYGSIDNLGIKWDGRDERVLYTRFRRTPTHKNMMKKMQRALKGVSKEQRLKTTRAMINTCWMHLAKQLLADHHKGGEIKQNLALPGILVGIGSFLVPWVYDAFKGLKDENMDTQTPSKSHTHGSRCWMQIRRMNDYPDLQGRI